MGMLSDVPGERRSRPGQQTARNRLRGFGLQVAAAASGTAFHSYAALMAAHTVERAGAVVQGERGERPVGIGQHLDAAFGADQNGEISGRCGGLGRGFCGIQDGFGVLDEGAECASCAHTELIGPAGRSFEKRLGRDRPSRPAPPCNQCQR